MKIFIYAATGTVGSKLTDALVSQGHEILAGTRHPEKFPAKKGITPVKVDAGQPGTGTEALKGADAAYLLSPPGFTNQYEILHPFIAAAKAAGVKKVVLMTAMGVEFAPPEAPFRKLELELEASGLTWNILRPNWFMQNFQTFWISGILKDRKIYFPGGSAKASFIDAGDIAAVAVKLLTTSDRDNEAINITGEQALDHAQVATLLSRVSGKPVEYADISPEDFRSGLLGAGVPADYAEFLVYIAGALKEGHASAVTSEVKKITGKNPVSFEEYSKSNARVWAA